MNDYPRYPRFTAPPTDKEERQADFIHAVDRLEWMLNQAKNKPGLIRRLLNLFRK